MSKENEWGPDQEDKFWNEASSAIFDEFKADNEKTEVKKENEKKEDEISPKRPVCTWTIEEDVMLIYYYQTIGPKWSVLCNYFPGKSVISIKNRWHRKVKSEYLRQLKEERNWIREKKNSKNKEETKQNHDPEIKEPPIEIVDSLDIW